MKKSYFSMKMYLLLSKEQRRIFCFDVILPQKCLQKCLIAQVGSCQLKLLQKILTSLLLVASPLATLLLLSPWPLRPLEADEEMRDLFIPEIIFFINCNVSNF